MKKLPQSRGVFDQPTHVGAVHRPVPFGLINLSTPAAFSRCRGVTDAGVPAFLGAVNRSLLAPPSVEPPAAMGTCKGTTPVARCRASRSGNKFLAAVSACPDDSDGKRKLRGQLGVVDPKLLFGFAVAFYAKGYQVVQSVSPHVVAFEKAERADVMDWETPLSEAAVLTGVAIASASDSLFPIPVRTPVVDRSTFPRGVVGSDKLRIPSPPLPVARTGAEVPLAGPDLVWLFGASLPARSAFDHHARLSLTYSMYPLPDPVAAESAKRISGGFGMVGLSEKPLAALNACNLDHHYLRSD